MALDVEGANRAQAPAGERFRERLEALAIRPNRARALVRLRPFQELLLRVLEADVSALPADAGLALQNLAALHARQLSGDGAGDPLPQPRDVALTIVHEVEPVGPTAEIDAVASAGHHAPSFPGRRRHRERSITFLRACGAGPPCSLLSPAPR